MNEWIQYQPKRERDKTFYDIKLRDGKIVKCCYPNGVHWNPFDGGESKEYKPIADYRVVAIRICEHPIKHSPVKHNFSFKKHFSES